MKVLLQSVLALIILAFPIYVQSCPNCVEPEIFPYNLLELSDGICIEVETYCRDAYGNEYQCPPAFPSECFYENDALQLCFRVTNWCGVGDFSAEQVGLEIAGQQVNFWTEHITPSWPGQTFDFCLDPDQIVNFYTPGLAFAEGQLPTVNFIIDDYSYATMQVVIPDGAVVVGDLASDGNYQWSESFPVASNLGFKSCLGDPQQSITGSAGISFSENSGWSIGGVINMGGQEQSITGSFSASYSFGASSGNSYETSITGFLPVVEEEDCEGFAGSNCDKCCFHLNAAVEQEIQQYQLVEYSCEGGALVQEELVPVIAGYGAVQFSLGSYISCPSSPLYINPRKLYDDGNRFVPLPPLGIAIEEFIDFDLYTLTWSGPNGFTAVNQTLLENLEPGEYCYTLTHCSCENPVDKGCLVLCPEATPVSGWRYHEEKGLYCREFTCGQVPGIMNECVDGAACSEWEYAEENNACFREACHEGELLFVESNAPYEISYEYQNHFCQAIIACREGEELIIETPAEYSEPFFDETEGTCFRYVICGGQSIGTEEAGISNITWEYTEFEGCMGTVQCNEGALHDGEVSGGYVETQFEDWEYDEQNGCLRDVTCSYNNDFEERLYGTSSGEEWIFWEFDNSGDICMGTVSCDGDVVENIFSLPDFGDWEENTALYNVECVRDAFCGNPSLFGMQFEDYGDIFVSFESGPCVDGLKPCYIQIECDGDVVVGNDFVAEIPCEDYCAGNLLQRRAATAATGVQALACGVKLFSHPGNGMVIIDFREVGEKQIEQVQAVDISTGRVVSQMELAPEDLRAPRPLKLPNTGVFALIFYTRSGPACYSRIVRY